MLSRFIKSHLATLERPRQEIGAEFGVDTGLCHSAFLIAFSWQCLPLLCAKQLGAFKLDTAMSSNPSAFEDHSDSEMQ